MILHDIFNFNKYVFNKNQEFTKNISFKCLIFSTKSINSSLK